MPGFRAVNIKSKSTLRKTALTSILIIPLFLSVFALGFPISNASSTPINLSNHTGYMSGVDVAAFGSNVYVVWSDNTTGIFQIYFVSSYDSGLTWNSVQQLTNYSGPSAESLDPRIAANGNYVYIMYLNGSNSYCCNNELLLQTSSDKGSTFGSAFTLASGAYEGGGDIATNGNNVYVAWDICNGCPSNEDIFFRASTNNGASFGPQLQLSNTPFYSFNPRIAVSGSHVYVAWTDNGNGAASEILYATSSNNGTTFTTQQSLSNDNSNNYYGVGIAAFNGDPHVFALYIQTSGFNGAPCPCNLLFKTSSDNGSTFGSPITVATLSIGSVCCPNFNGYTGPGLAEIPSLLVTGQGFYAGWYDMGSSNVQVFLSKSNDSGLIWQAKQNISNDSDFAGYSSLASSGNSTYAVWEDNSTGHLNAYFLNLSPGQSSSNSSQSTSASQSSNQSTISTATIHTSTSHSTSNSSSIGGFVLPPSLQPYSSIITIALLFVSGLLMGIGIKRALVGAILIIVGLLVASFSGLGLPFLSPAFIIGHLLAIMQSQLKDLGPVFFTFPIFWIIGFAVGIWKG